MFLNTHRGRCSLKPPPPQKPAQSKPKFEPGVDKADMKTVAEKPPVPINFTMENYFMKTVLFINGCVRGEHSRTLEIANVYIQELKKQGAFTLVERNLCREKPQYMTDKSFHPKTGKQEDSTSELAKEFAAADEIILAAPFWEFMFPAVVSCYFEEVSAVGTTFNYTPEGSVGLCKARSLTYIYTAGDCLCDEDRISEKFMLRLAKLYGIPSCSFISVDGLDIETNDAQALVDGVCNKIRTNQGAL